MPSRYLASTVSWNACELLLHVHVQEHGMSAELFALFKLTIFTHRN